MVSLGRKNEKIAQWSVVCQRPKPKPKLVLVLVFLDPRGVPNQTKNNPQNPSVSLANEKYQKKLESREKIDKAKRNNNNTEFVQVLGKQVVALGNEATANLFGSTTRARTARQKKARGG
jgi:hypothetical protein